MLRRFNLSERTTLKRAEPADSRVNRLARLRQYYLQFLVEDGMDGTPFDCAVLDAIQGLADRFKGSDPLVPRPGGEVGRERG